MVSLIDLFKQATNDDSVSSLSLNLEIAECLNSSARKYHLSRCAEGVEYFKQLLGNTNLRTIDKTLGLLECCIKNCSITLHEKINDRELVPSLLNLLKRKREKLTFLEKLSGLYAEDGWRQIETKVLWFIQLWADTFMMQEHRFPSFMKAYRELRSDGLKFPPRSADDKFAITFEGEPSPAFELAEYENPIPVREEPRISQFDFKALKFDIHNLEVIILNASNFHQLRNTNVKEMVKGCRLAQRNLILFVSYKEFNKHPEVEGLVELMEYVNAKMQAIKNAAKLLKRGATKQEIFQVLRVHHGIDEEDDEDFLETSEEIIFNRLEPYIEEVEQPDAVNLFLISP